jgi:tricorn protease-like protein
MKKQLILLFVAFFFLECIHAQENYSLQEVKAEASCTDYIIISSDGQKVDLIPEVSAALKCPAVASIYQNYLVYLSDLDVKLYDIEKQKTRTLFSIYEDIDGISNPAWSPDGTKMAFVIINQQLLHDYEDICRIVVLTMKNGKVDKMQKFDRPVMFSCGGICTSVPGQDFWFENEELIIYMDKFILMDKMESGGDAGNPTQKIHLNE